MTSAAVQGRRDVLPLVCSVQLRLVAGGGAVPADGAALCLYTDQEVLLDLRHRRLGYVLMSHGLCSSVLCLPDLSDVAGSPSVTTVVWALLKKQLDDEG